MVQDPGFLFTPNTKFGAPVYRLHTNGVIAVLGSLFTPNTKFGGPVYSLHTNGEMVIFNPDSCSAARDVKHAFDEAFFSPPLAVGANLDPGSRNEPRGDALGPNLILSRGGDATESAPL